MLYATAMAVDVVAALATGWLYDRHGARVLIALPVLTAGVVTPAFTDTVAIAVAGSLVLGCGHGRPGVHTAYQGRGPGTRRATAYGLFAGAVGAASLAGGALIGGLYGYSMSTTRPSRLHRRHPV